MRFASAGWVLCEEGRWTRARDTVQAQAQLGFGLRSANTATRARRAFLCVAGLLAQKGDALVVLSLFRWQPSHVDDLPQYHLDARRG